MKLPSAAFACTAIFALLAVSACADTGGDDQGSAADGGQSSQNQHDGEQPEPTETGPSEQELYEEALQEYEAALAGPSETHREDAAELVAEMDLPQLAGQVIMGEYSGTDAAAGAQTIEQLHLGGMILMGHNIPGGTDSVDTEQLAADLTALAEAGSGEAEDSENAGSADNLERAVPPLLGVDQEGGLVTRVGTPLTHWPTPMAYGAAHAADPQTGAELARAGHHRLGADLVELGFNVSFAPAADATIGAVDPVIGARSFGNDPEAVSELALQGIRGLAASGMVGSIKHFPGHGSVTEDSHYSLPVQDSSLQELQQRDWLPFAEAIEAGVPAIMMGHIDVPALEEGVPSSLSSAAYTELRDMGFDGVVVTDALNMGAIANTYGADEAPVLALEAGADLLLMPASSTGAHEAIVSAVESEQISRQRLEEAAQRVVALALWQQDLAAGELAAGPSATLDDALENEGEENRSDNDDEPNAPAVDLSASETSSTELATELARASATLMEGSCEAPVVDEAIQISGGTEQDRALLTEAAHAAGLETGWGTTVTLLGGLTPAAADVVVTLDRPEALADSSAETKVALYGRSRESFDQLIALLTGEQAHGALPVSVGDHSRGDSAC